MADEPVLLFLHGVGVRDDAERWRIVLSNALADLGYPDLGAARVIAPKYWHSLRDTDDDDPLPGLTIDALSGDAAKQHQRAFERRTSAIETTLGRHEDGPGWPIGDVIVDVAEAMPYFAQARNYLTKPRIRAQVLTRVLSRLPDSGRLVIVGHSLGSVIAADLVRRLPADLQVVGMVTIGSPLGNPSFQVDRLAAVLKAPPPNLAWWVNFWNPRDPVTAGRGVSSAFPWMLDCRTHSPANLHVHDAETYLDNKRVAEAVGLALFGSRSKELVPADRGLDIPPDYAETVALMALRYAHLIKAGLQADKQARYAEALRQMQATTVARVMARNAADGRPSPVAITRLTFDLTDPDSSPPEPKPISHLSKEEAVVPLISLAVTNLIQPFEIHVGKDVQREAMRSLTLEMGVGSEIGANALVAVDRAREVTTGGTNWLKWAAIGVGAAALILATGGLALAAAPGVAGAAAITSALAAFGPGGMMGGLLTAGTLVSAGGSGIAFGLASSGTAAATVEAVVRTVLAAVILRELEGIEQDPVARINLVDTSIEIRRAMARLESVSDKSAPSLKELKLKQESVDRALKYLDEHYPGPCADDGRKSRPS